MISRAPVIRLGRDSDAAAFIALIGVCWGQYPGVHLDVDGEMPELRGLASYYTRQGGALWTAEADHDVAGMIAARPLDGGTWEVCRVYVHPSLHGSGLAHRLLETAEAHAIAAGATRLKLWSDTRFDRAHRFYEKRSYVRTGPLRVLADISQSLEFAYAKPVDGVERLEPAAAVSAEPRLAVLLRACASERHGLLPDVGSEDAQAFWRAAAREVATGTRILLAGWAGGHLAGAVSLDLARAATRSHRAQVETLLVDSAERRRGLGRALLHAVEASAKAVGRTVLSCEVPADGPAEALFRAADWQESARLPGATRRADGRLDDGIFFWKRLG